MSETKAMVNLHGELRYIKNEDGVWSAALILRDLDQCSKLKEACVAYYPRLEPVTPKFNDETQEWSVNIKSKYTVKVIDITSEPVTEELRNGATVIARCKITEYQYMKKKGLTLYVNGILLKENGPDYSLKADDFND